jgi:outer membrane protein assembly factor BamB
VLLEGHDERGRTDRLTRVRVRDGKSIWSRVVPGTRESTTTERDGKAAEVVTITDDNQLTVLRLADGVVTGRGRLSPPVATIRGIGPYLVAADSLDVSTTTTVYRVDDLAPLWSTADGGLDYCSPVFCRSYEGDLAGLDPATGRELWHRPGEVSPRPWPGGRLLLTGPEIDGADPPTYQVVDAATGRPKGRPGRGLVAWQPEPADAALVLRPPISDPGRTSVTRVDLTTGRSTFVGTTDATIGTNCADLGRHLACPVPDRLVVLAVD